LRPGTEFLCDLLGFACNRIGGYRDFKLVLAAFHYCQFGFSSESSRSKVPEYHPAAGLAGGHGGRRGTGVSNATIEIGAGRRSTDVSNATI
jgi:hypothetical protein